MLYILRHGKTDWNAAFKLQGRTDIELNEEGRKMAAKAAKEAECIDFDICFSSPLKRAYETARIVLKDRDIPIVCDDRLMEMCFGEYEGIERSFDIKDCPINPLFKDPINYVADKGAESFEELFKRTGDFLDDKIYPLLNEGKDILIVGHGAMNCSIVSQIKGYDLAHFWDGMTDNCKLVRLL
jgi:probable phosphoglycerate mutase